MKKIFCQRTLVSAAVLASGLGLQPSAWAQTSGEVDANTWRFQVTPYVWMSGLEGRVRPTQNAPTASVEKSFSDVLGDLDAAAFVTGTARNGRSVLMGDFSYASVSDTASLPFGLSANTKVRQTSLTFIGGRNWQVNPESSIDLMAGVRLWDIKANVQVPGLLAVASKTSFADPILAIRWRYDFAPRWSTLTYVDAGGLGVGSDFTWQFLGSVNYQLKENIHLSVGYRQLSVDYNDKGKQLDFNLGGPIIGATFRF